MEFKRFILEDLIEFNPSRVIPKGGVAPFVEMAAIPEGSREIEYSYIKEFNGSGTRFRNGDTLFARITPCLENGKTAKVSELGDNVIGHGSTEFIVFSAKDPLHDEDLVYYICRHPQFREYAKTRMQGTSGRQRVDWKSLAEYEIELPSNPEDRKIVASHFKTLDDKIKINKLLNNTLESIAQTLFKSWFVDFDPVRAKVAAIANGKDPQLAAMQAISGKTVEELQNLSPENHQKLAATAALFPDELMETEHGEIPKEWSLAEVQDLLNHNKSGISPSSTPETIFKHFSLPAFDNGEIPINELGKSIKSNKYLIKKSTILVSKLNPHTPRVWDIIGPEQNSICSTEFQSFEPKEEFYFEFASQLFKSERITQVLAGMVTGTSKSHQRVRPTDMLTLPFIRPSEQLIHKFSDNLRSNYRLKQRLKDEKNNLSELRDTLLPKIMDGSLTISAV